MLSNSFQRIPKVSRRFRSTSVPDDDVILLLVVVRISHCPVYVSVCVCPCSRRLCSGIQRVWTRHTPTTLPPSENESFLSRHDDVRADRNAEYIVDQIGEMEFHVDEEHRNAAWFLWFRVGAPGDGSTERFAFESRFEKQRWPRKHAVPLFLPIPSSVRATINVRSVMGQPVKIVRPTVTYGCAIPPIDLHNFESLDFVGLPALQLIQYRGLYRSLVYVITSAEYFAKILLSKWYI